MAKLLCLAILLVVPISIFADCELQELGYVLQDRYISDLIVCNATSEVWNDDFIQFVRFDCKTDKDPKYVNDEIIAYMGDAVGDVKTSYKYDACTQTFSILYEGDFCPWLKKPSKMQSLVRVLRDYPSPVLGSHKCQQTCFESKAGLTVIGITIPCFGRHSDTCCDEVYYYLRSSNYLDENVARQCCPLSYGSAYLQLWDIPSGCTACIQ